MSPRPRPQILQGSFVHCKTRTELEFLHDAAVAVDGQGRIAGVEVDGPDGGNGEAQQGRVARQRLLEKLEWKESDVDVFSARPGQFFFPGFIDTHIHAPQYPNAGLFGKSTLLDWLETYTFPLEASLKDLPKARAAYTACVRRTLAHGTTTATYYATVHVPSTNLLADLCLSLGQRAFVGRVCMDDPNMCPAYYRDESAEAGLEATMQTIEHVKSIDPGYELVSPILTPRFAPSCTRESMLGLARIQKETGLPVQTHISENVDECKLVASMFPEAGSYAHTYDKHGLLTSKTVLAHAVHITQEEATLISQRKAKIAHCPCSNSSLTSGEARVRWMWDNGIDVGLGTDVSGGYSPSILQAARLAAMVSRHVAMKLEGEERERSKLSVEEVLYLATRGGAQCLNLQDKVGAFEVGMEWDAQLISLHEVKEEQGLENGYGESNGVSGAYYDSGNVDVFGWESWEERVAKWVYNGDDRNTHRVWVKGRLVHSRDED